MPLPDAPDLAGTASSATGGSVGGIRCLGAEQLAYHIHAHLTLFVNGVARRVPYGIGIISPQAFNTPQGVFLDGAGCFYWLHTHAADGIIHIESPVEHTFTLGTSSLSGASTSDRIGWVRSPDRSRRSTTAAVTSATRATSR